LPPHLVQRADRRMRLLEASGPQRIISGTKATGRRCRQRSQTTQHHGWPRRSCSSVGAGGAGFMPPIMQIFAKNEQPRELVASSASSPSSWADCRFDVNQHATEGVPLNSNQRRQSSRRQKGVNPMVAAPDNPDWPDSREKLYRERKPSKGGMARAILDRRYASGEITGRQYERLLRELGWDENREKGDCC